MAAEYTFYISSTEADEPVTLETTQTIVIKNTGDETGTELGFYLRSASSMGDVDYPSTDSPAVNLWDIFSQGNDGYGLTITQGLTTTRFKPGVGDSYTTRIPLSIGSGTLFNELASNEQIEVTITLSFAPSTPTKSFYVDLVLE